MFSWIRRRATYANVAMTIALVFAMSGGAYAAKKYLITSTKQISPSVLKALVGKRGPAGANGALGAQGSVGPQGPAGANGKDGANGADGKEGQAGAKGATGPAGPAGAKGANGAAGPTGPAGSPWTAGGTLPEGSTETGGWAVGSIVDNGETLSSPARTAISFPIPLKADLTGENIQQNQVGFPAGATEKEIEHCPGSSAEPKAASGFLCVYTATLISAAFPFPVVETLTSAGITTSPGSSASGALVSVIPGNPKNPGDEVKVEGWGSWAVTG